MRISNYSTARKGKWPKTKTIAASDIGKKSGETRGDVLVAEPHARTKKPSLYKVVLLNDDYTPMEFVVQVLEIIFRKPRAAAVQVMMDVHKKGSGICGVYTKDVAETKADEVIRAARAHEHPLQCTIEKA